MLLLRTPHSALASYDEAPDLDEALMASEQAFTLLHNAIDTRELELQAAIHCQTQPASRGGYAGAPASHTGHTQALEAKDWHRIRSAHTTTNALSVIGIGLLGTGVGLGIAGVP